MVILAALLLAAPAAPAPRVDVDADLRCLALVTLGATEIDKAQPGGAAMGAMYFVGRIDGAQPGFDYRGALIALMSDEAKVAALQAEAPRCGGILQERGGMLEALGRALVDESARKDASPRR